MKWMQGDFIKIAEEEDIRHICFTANNALKANGSLTMGAGAALAIAVRFPDAASELGRMVSSIQRQDDAYDEDYHLAHALVTPTRWKGKLPHFYIRVTAVQVKRDWRRDGDWDLTQESLTQLSGMLNRLKTKDQPHAVMNCPLIGKGGFAHREQEVRAMVEQILKDTDIIVCTL